MDSKVIRTRHEAGDYVPEGKAHPRTESNTSAYTSLLNRIKSKIHYLKTKNVKLSDEEKEKEINRLMTYRSILKLSDAKINEFNRINALIGREPFDKAKALEEFTPI